MNNNNNTDSLYKRILWIVFLLMIVWWLFACQDLSNWLKQLSRNQRILSDDVARTNAYQDEKINNISYGCTWNTSAYEMKLMDYDKTKVSLFDVSKTPASELKKERTKEKKFIQTFYTNKYIEDWTIVCWFTSDDIIKDATIQ